jgi:hypothetical protein
MLDPIAWPAAAKPTPIAERHDARAKQSSWVVAWAALATSALAAVVVTDFARGKPDGMVSTANASPSPAACDPRAAEPTSTETWLAPLTITPDTTEPSSPKHWPASDDPVDLVRPPAAPRSAPLDNGHSALGPISAAPGEKL